MTRAADPHGATLTQTPYCRLLGPEYHQLHPHVRVAHEAPLSAEGAMNVEHGSQFLTPFLVRVMKLPARGTSLPVTLRLTDEPDHATGLTTMTWRRQIGATVLDTRQFARHDRLVEQSGPGTIEFALQADAHGSLHYSDVGCRFMGVSLPRFLAPRVRAQVSANPDGWHVEVNVQWRGRLVCRYAGAMRRVSYCDLVPRVASVRGVSLAHNRRRRVAIDLSRLTTVGPGSRVPDPARSQIPGALRSPDPRSQIPDP